MDPKEISLKANLRLERIKTAGRYFKWLVGFMIVVGVYWFAAFCFGWPFIIQDQVRIVVSTHVYKTRAEMPLTILVWWIVQTVLSIFCSVVLFNLFRLYEQGILFSAKNVRYIRFLGYYSILSWIVDDQMQSFQKDMALSMGPVFVGLLIIFIAWIMDEGRKIQEEQALTV